MLSLASGLAACQTAAPEPSTFTWVCPDGTRFSTAYPNDETAVLSHNGHRYTLSAAVSASGARYSGDGYEFWEHQGEARFVDTAGAVHENCRPH